MPARSRARKRALDILYAADLRGQDAVAALDQRIEAGEGPSNPYVGFLVRGVVEHQARIDELLAEYSQGWALNRMPAVDRNVLRIGVWELLDGDVASEVAISEATALVTELSTDDSPSFVNGVLAAVAQVFAEHGVSIQTVRQQGRGDDAQLVVVTHRARDAALSATVDALRDLPSVRDVTSVMRVEGEA